MANGEKNSATRAQRRLLLLFVGIALSLIIAAVGVLRFGNPQSCRWAYMFQAYVWPGKAPEPPEGYSGLWNEWFSNGQMCLQTWMKKGALNGPALCWDFTGHLRTVMTNTAWGEKDWDTFDVLQQGTVLSWDADGREIAVGRYVSGAPFDGTFAADRGSLLKEYRDGKPYDGFFVLRGGEVLVMKEGKVMVTSRIGEKNVGELEENAQKESIKRLKDAALTWDHPE